MEQTWRPGEAGAHARLRAFAKKPLASYPKLRDRPDRDGTSAFSPHLHFGEISVRQVWHALAAKNAKARESVFVSELLWREFAHHSLYHFPHTVLEPLDRRFERFAWSRDAAHLRPGSGAAPAFPSWMQACASCGRPAGCTTACA